MEFLALAEEQAQCLAAAHKQRPMRALARLFGMKPETYLPVDLEPIALGRILTHPALRDSPTVHLYLREVALPGDFAWQQSPRAEGGLTLDFVRSLCAQVWPCVQLGDDLIAGSTGVAGKGYYEDAGVDQAVPQRLKALLDRAIARMCPCRAAPPGAVEALRSGERTFRSISGVLVHVSPGAVRLRRAGGHWVHPSSRRAGWEFEPVEAPAGP